MDREILTVYIIQNADDRLFGWDPKVQLDPPADAEPGDCRAERYYLPEICRIGKNTKGGTSVFRGDRYVPIIMNPEKKICMIDSTVDTFRYVPLEPADPVPEA